MKRSIRNKSSELSSVYPGDAVFIVVDGFDGDEEETLRGTGIFYEGNDVMPGGGKFGVSGSEDGLAMNFGVRTAERIEDRFVETANPAHTKYRGEHPFVVAGGIRLGDRVLMPVLRGADRRFQSSAAHQLGHGFVDVDVVKREMNQVEGFLGDGHMV